MNSMRNFSRGEMATVTKIAPNRQEGQEKALYKIEERMHFILSQIAECDRAIRLAREAEKRIVDLRAELADIAEEYTNFLSRGEIAK